LIIASDNLEQSIDKKIKYFSDKTYILSIINTEGSLGVVCYLINDTWQPFCYDYGVKKFKNKSKTYRELINNIPQLARDNIADIKGKFYNTYGRSKNFYVDDYVTVNRLDKVNISIHFKIHPVFGTDEIEFIENIKLFIKEYIEGINNAGTNSIYISNLIKALENNFSSIEYLKFCGINEYPTEVQAIENTTVDLDTLTKEERINYVPEYLTLSKDDIIIDII